MVDEMYELHFQSRQLFSILKSGFAQFDGDLEKYFICVACLLAAATDALRDARVDSRGESAEELQTVLTSELSVSSVAAMTDIPRETVRRKLISLLENGVVEQGGSGKYIFKMQYRDINTVMPFFHEFLNK